MTPQPVPVSALRRAIALCTPGVHAGRTTLTVAQTFRLSPGKLGAFDFERYARCEMAALEGLPAVNIPARPLVAALRAVGKAHTVTFAVNGDRVTMRSNDDAPVPLSIRLPILGNDAMPILPPAATGQPARFDQAEWERVARVARAAGTDDTLPVLTAIELAVRDGMLWAGATDRYRLMLSRVRTANAGRPAVLLPARTIRLWTQLTKADAFGTELHLTSKDDRWKWAHLGTELPDGGKYDLTFTPHDGQFPNLHPLLSSPEALTTAVTVPRAPTLQALRALADFAGNHSNTPVVLKPTGGDLVMTTRDPSGSDDTIAEATIHGITTTGPVLDPAVNPRYLADALAASNGQEVTLRMVTIARPIVVDDGDPSLHQLVMPFRRTG